MMRASDIFGPKREIGGKGVDRGHSSPYGKSGKASSNGSSWSGGGDAWSAGGAWSGGGGAWSGGEGSWNEGGWSSSSWGGGGGSSSSSSQWSSSGTKGGTGTKGAGGKKGSGGKKGCGKQRPAGKGAAKSAKPQEPTPNTVVLMGTGRLPPGCELGIEEKARQVCIENGLSTPERVRYVSTATVFIDFPYIEVCIEFLAATKWQLKVGDQMCKLTAPNSSEKHDWSGEQSWADDVTVEERPTDTVMVRNIGDFQEGDVMKAFQEVVPTVKSVRIVVDRSTRKSRGFCFVMFYSIAEAETAVSRLQAAGSLLSGRKVAISFAKPQTQEQAMASDLIYQKELSERKALAEQALNGVNADMWASYMQFCKKEGVELRTAGAASGWAPLARVCAIGFPGIRKRHRD
eukprot:CAMPEP_0204238494 /NCGR_PEP_ID=MMETSP0361-20130328/93897_1 /ASSEMBLY_ACC=CAM_ASM_000343 /TAXON_ID=268821 /ORGANISM="Scrippsiella Hangoei, Strain SHTV-5" /LENGTH=401 /DNA_ID=CAMNT_0051211269 /DNA_START=77 /DNA_END=1280 /DNA_ORIENTATION=+